MADRFNTIAQALLNKSFEDCSEEELFNLTEQYPYSAAVQFLYLKKSSPESETYKNQFQKAILYYPNPVGFDYFINEFHSDFDEEWKSWLQEPLTQQNATEADGISIEEKEDSVVPTSIEEHEVEEIKTTSVEVSQPELKKIVEETTAEQPVSDMAFEPFHTVDYFASQGIKLSVEEIPKDKLGKQLKSFTEWLKTMKKLPVQEAGRHVDGIEERRVENLAAKSVKTSDIITESMAEVWLSQGNKQKAIEVYRKLSLLNPAKSAYFAAKIENLNDSN